MPNLKAPDLLRPFNRWAVHKTACLCLITRQEDVPIKYENVIIKALKWAILCKQAQDWLCRPTISSVCQKQCKTTISFILMSRYYWKLIHSKLINDLYLLHSI
jgi:hypothetical protein